MLTRVFKIKTTTLYMVRISITEDQSNLKQIHSHKKEETKLLNSFMLWNIYPTCSLIEKLFQSL